MKELNLKALEQALLMDKERLWKQVDRQLVSFRYDLLVKIANREFESVQLKLSYFQPLVDAGLYLKAQTALRMLWSPTNSFRTKQVLVDGWLSEATQHSRRGSGSQSFNAWLAREKFEFSFDNFRGQLVTAILENWRYFRICGNPDCPEKYFIAERTTQRYCERGECTRYAQRRHALNWWREHKAKNRKKSEEL